MNKIPTDIIGETHESEQSVMGWILDLTPAKVQTIRAHSHESPSVPLHYLATDIGYEQYTSGVPTGRYFQVVALGDKIDQEFIKKF